MKERPGRFTMRMLYGLGGLSLAMARWVDGDDLGALYLFVWMGLFAVYVVWVMWMEARQ